MTLSSLVGQLRMLGWNVRFSRLGHEEWHAWRSTTAVTDCLLNRKPPKPAIFGHRLEDPVSNEIHESCSFKISGMVAGDRWICIEMYSVPVDKAIETIPFAERVLVAAWEAASNES